MRHVGELFLQMSAVNLLGRVLDTPDAMSNASDHISTLYKSVSAGSALFFQVGLQAWDLTPGWLDLHTHYEVGR